MKTKDKLIAIGVIAILLILAAGAGAYRIGDTLTQHPVKASDLAHKRLGGVSGRMPDNSSEIFFESMLGCDLSGYVSYDSIDAALYGLYAGETSAVWAADVTAEYLKAVRPELMTIDISDSASIQQTAAPRTMFGMAMRNDPRGKLLAARVDLALEELRSEGELDRLIATYITDAVSNAGMLTSEDMTADGKDTLRIGISGTVAPVELFDSEGRPCGFCVALSDAVCSKLGMKAELVAVKGETEFSELMAGRIDAVFCYGTGRVTTEGTRNWVTTGGYYPMQRYEFLTLRDEER